MRRAAALVIAILLALSAPSFAEDAPAPVEPVVIDTTRPDGVLRELYTAYFNALNQEDGKADMREYAARYFEPTLASKFAAAAAQEGGPVSFDIFINAQDHDELVLGEIKRVVENAKEAVFDVRFTNMDQDQKVRFGLVKTGNSWKITEMDFGQGVTLSRLLNPEEPQKPALGSQ